MLKTRRKKRAELHQAVDDIIDSHIHCMTEHSQKLGEEIDREVDKLQEDESELMKMLETFQKTTMVGLDLIEFYEKLRNKTEILQALDVSQYCNKQVYTEGKIDRDGIQKMTGGITDITSSTNSADMMSSFKHKETSVVTICPLSENDAWVTHSDMTKINSFRRDGHLIKSVYHASDFSFILHDGGFLFCNRKQKKILKVDMSGNSSVWMDTSPLEASYIGKALNGSFLISLWDEFCGTRTKQSQRRVRMVTPSDDVLHSYEYGEDDSTAVLPLPVNVTQNANSDVCVMNKYEVAKGDFRGNVCVFYEDGGFKYLYSGRGGEFNPEAICCDLLCNIICANRFENSIHVVSSEGVFLKYLVTSDTGVPVDVPMAYSLALHRCVLWVGSRNGVVRVYRYSH